MTDQFPFEAVDEPEGPDQVERERSALEQAIDEQFDQGYLPQDQWSDAEDYLSGAGEHTDDVDLEQRLEQEQPEVEDDWDEEVAAESARQQVGTGFGAPDPAPLTAPLAAPATGAADRALKGDRPTPGLYPPIEPYASGLLEVGDGQRIYWEECGNPDGRPAVFLHGGPGGGAMPAARSLFDPERYRIVLLDQRGCGRSLPHASEPDADLSLNTTWHLVADLERLRQIRGIERWLVHGGSWGSALALAYAETHPDRVTELVLRGIFTLRTSELDWYYNGGAGNLFPERYEQFLQPLGGATFSGDAIAAYAELLFDPDPAVHLPAGVAWATWEAATVHLMEDQALIEAFRDPRFALAFARIENHYFTHGGWFEEGQLLAQAARLAGIPGVIVQGRYDMATPAVTAWDLSKVWSDGELRMVAAAGHSGTEPGIVAELVAATNRYADRTVSQ